MRIGQLAKNAGIGVETVRYYQRIGLMSMPDRRIASFRVYGKSDLKRLHFIRRAKELGFSLDDISGLLRLSEDDCADVQSMARNKLILVREKLAHLIRMEKALKDIISQCSHRSDQSGCPIMSALGEETEPSGRPHFLCQSNTEQTGTGHRPSTRVNQSTSLPVHLRTATGAKKSGAVRKPRPDASGKEST